LSRQSQIEKLKMMLLMQAVHLASMSRFLEELCFHTREEAAGVHAMLQYHCASAVSLMTLLLCDLSCNTQIECVPPFQITCAEIARQDQGVVQLREQATTAERGSHTGVRNISDTIDLVNDREASDIREQQQKNSNTAAPLGAHPAPRSALKRSRLHEKECTGHVHFAPGTKSELVSTASEVCSDGVGVGQQQRRSNRATVPKKHHPIE
jgi:hypothetical protein